LGWLAGSLAERYGAYQRPAWTNAGAPRDYFEVRPGLGPGDDPSEGVRALLPAMFN